MGVLLPTPSLKDPDSNIIPDDQLPNWFLLKKFAGLEIDIEHWPDYADERVNKFLREKVWHIARDDVEKEKQEIAGHLLLRLTAATNPRLATWVVENEGDLFAFRYRNADLEQKLDIAKYLLGASNVRTIEELESIIDQEIIMQFELNRPIQYTRKRQEKGVSRTGQPTIRTVFETTPLKDGTQVGFYFSAVPDVVSERKTFLYQGWAIAPMFVFHLSVKRAFEAQLRNVIVESVEKLRLDKRVANLAYHLAKQMEKVIRPPDLLELDGDLSGTTLYKRYDLFPLCSRDLIATLRSKGHLSHMENLQLGFFLKALGMPVEEQMWFWYENSVDNVGRTFEQFERKVGYLIRHIYGLEGRKIDYKAPRCKTIINRYYCPYMKRSPKDIEVIVRESVDSETLTENEQTLTKIRELSTIRRATAACSLFFALKFGRKTSIRTPVQYVREAVASQKPLPEERETGEEENNKSAESQK